MSGRLQRAHALRGSFRPALHDLIRAEPGITFLGLVDRLRATPDLGARVGYGCVTHHLSVLERFRLVTSRKSGRARRYYAQGGPWGRHASAMAALQAPRAQALARIVLEEPGLSQQGVWQRYAQTSLVARPTVVHHVQRLRAAGLIQVARAGQRLLHEPTPLLSALLNVLSPNAVPQLAPGLVEAPLAEVA